MRTSAVAVIASVLFVSTPSHAALVDNGGGFIYDTVLDITWAQPDFRRSWYEANAWAAGLWQGLLNGAVATDWRLPYISVAAGAGPLGPDRPPGTPVDCSTASEVACRDNELGYMFYHNLSGTLGESILESGDPDLALFPTLQSSDYWSGTEYGSRDAWIFVFDFGFGFGFGFQDYYYKNFNDYSPGLFTRAMSSRSPPAPVC